MRMEVSKLYISVIFSTAKSPLRVSTLLNKSKAIPYPYTRQWFPLHPVPGRTQD